MGIIKDKSGQHFIDMFIGRNGATWGQHVKTYTPSLQSKEKNNGTYKPTVVMRNPFSLWKKEHSVPSVDMTNAKIFPVIVDGKQMPGRYLRLFPQGYFGEKLLEYTPKMAMQERDELKHENQLLKRERIKLRKKLQKLVRKDEIDRKELYNILKEMRQASHPPVPDALRDSYGYGGRY